MIYEYPPADAPLRQGDIFLSLPRVEMSLKQVPVITPDGTQQLMTWDDIVRDDVPVAAVLALKPVTAIVVSQDCDASRSPELTLCEIRPFQQVERKSKDTTSTAKWVGMITQQARLNQKWFYLPPEDTLGFALRMAVDFHLTLRVSRQDLESLRRLRPATLNEVARAHFRERIAEFFRRYPYNEWYPLSPDEMVEYRKNHPEADPYPWQVVPRVNEA